LPILADTRHTSFRAQLQEFGSALEREWSAIEYDPVGFAHITAAALAQGSLQAACSIDVISSWLSSGDPLPAQFDPNLRFAEPSITLYRSSGARSQFIIEVYYWRHTDVGIHDHGFSGAWTLLEGLSLHVQYRFHAEQELGYGLTRGRSEVTHIELLEPGPIRALPPGPDGLIHQVMHLAHPTTSLLVRMASAKVAIPQHLYLPRMRVRDKISPLSRWAALIARSGIPFSSEALPADAIAQLAEAARPRNDAPEPERLRACLERCGHGHPDVARVLEDYARIEKRRMAARGAEAS
jgi:hypothetical protein